MVKRDRSPEIMGWLSKVEGLLIMIVCLYMAWNIFFVWLSEDFISKGFAIFFGIVVFGVGILVGGYLLVGDVYKQKKRVEALRRHYEDVELSYKQPQANRPISSLPIVLSIRLSFVVYFGFAVFWLALGFLALMVISLHGFESQGWWFIVGWFVLGGIVLSLFGASESQRIEATQQGILVQKGFKRCTIPWEQAKLFASFSRLISADAGSTDYELSSVDALLRWDARYQGGPGLITFPQERAVYEERHRDLLSFIHQQTKLPLRDLR